MKRAVLGIAAVAMLVSSCAAPTEEPEPQAPELAQECQLEPELCGGGGGGEDPPPPSYQTYIVMMSGSVPQTAPSSVASSAVANYGGSVIQTYSGLRGFVVSTTEEGAEALRSTAGVIGVAMAGSGSSSSTPFTTSPTTQNAPGWALDRIDQRGWPLNNSYTYYGNGEGIRAYVLSDGINTAHGEFTANPASNAVDLVGSFNPTCASRGTASAGLIGGSTTGVAKRAQLRSVRVLRCNLGPNADDYTTVISGIDWVSLNGVRPAVVLADFSFYQPSHVDFTPVLNEAITQLIAKGYPVVTRAGYGGDASCNYSPGQVPGVITVGSTYQPNAQADIQVLISGAVPCVDLWAPGWGVRTPNAAFSSGPAYLQANWEEGAVVAGAVATWLGNHPSATPAQIQSHLVAVATPIADMNWGSGPVLPGRLLYVGPEFGAGNDLQDPVAVINGDITTWTTPNPATPWVITRNISANGSGSTDDGGVISSYAWRLCPNATPNNCLTSNGVSWNISNISPYLNFTLTLTVTDPTGKIGTASRQFVYTDWPTFQPPPP